MMKAIKVNFRMLDGRPTSTTIGGTIAEFYAQAFGVKSIDFVDNNGVINKKNMKRNCVNWYRMLLIKSVKIRNNAT